MYVKQLQRSGRVEVLNVHIHTNHSLGLEECKYIPLSQAVKKEIQEKFSFGKNNEWSGILVIIL